MHSPDLTQANVDRIAELFPTVITESIDADGHAIRAVDFDLLRQELSDHIVEGTQERYQLDWPGKRAAAFAANAPIAKTLRPVREESVNFDTTKNLFIEGDNLDALKLLQESYVGKVKLIYIDPPYNTGSDFVYEDDFAESSGEYLERSGQKSETGDRLVSNMESNGRFHSDWLSMMYPRLKLARNLLREDGVIMISIDDHEVASLRRMADQIFGEACFVGQFVWFYEGVNDNQDEVKKTHEYIVAYGRRPGVVFNKHVHDLNVDLPDTIENSVVKNGAANPPRPITLPVGFPAELVDGTLKAEDIRSISYDRDIIVKDGRVAAEVIATSGWSSADILQRFIDSGFQPVIDSKAQATRFILKRSGNIHYLKDRDQSYIISVLRNYGTTMQASESLRAMIGGRYFSFPKPVGLIRFLVDAVASPGDLVLDFFAGSGTTAEAVLSLNASDYGDRRFLLVQLPEELDRGSDAAAAGFSNIAEICRQRIRKVGMAIAEQVHGETLDLGFRSLCVDTTNMSDTRRSADHLTQSTLVTLTDSVKPDRTNDDLLFQVLIDWGLDLSLKIERGGVREYFRIADDALIACFSEELSADVVTEIAKLQPLRAVFRDSAFKSDADRINAEQLFRELSPGTEVKTI